LTISEKKEFKNIGFVNRIALS